MNSAIESFRPKLRPGRVIPHGSKLIFETENPYNQITLPMTLADLVLLCSGQFTVSEIVAKIYQKQGMVPFKSVLQALHMLHQGGFFENGHDLELNSYLNSWIPKRKAKGYVEKRLVRKMVSDRVSPSAFYLMSLCLLVSALFGLQYFPFAIFTNLRIALLADGLLGFAIKFWCLSSVFFTVKELLRGCQLLLLTGKVFNVSLRLDVWGVHLHVGDESTHQFSNSLYTTMFHLSQIIVGWSMVFAVAPVLDRIWLTPLLLIAMVSTFWQTNPFVRSDGLKLIQALLLKGEENVASWHFESSTMIQSINAEAHRRNQEFSRICTIWGAIWLLASTACLQETAIAFGPQVLMQVTHFSFSSAVAFGGLALWLATLFYVVQSFVETLAASLLRPIKRFWKSQVRWLRGRKNYNYARSGVLEKIRDLPLYSHFHDHNLMRVIEKSDVLEFAPGSIIVAQGQAEAELYVLLEGDIEVARNFEGGSEWITEFSSVSIFGEAALISDAPRAADVMAKTFTMVLKTPVSIIRQVAEESKVIREVDAFRNAILVNQFFASSPVFHSLSREAVDYLSSRGTLEYYDADESVFHQGESGDSLFLILRGKVSVTVHGVELKNITQGNFFGEIALLANVPRTGAIKTLEPCIFFQISADAIWQILIQNMDLGVFIESISESRLREDLSMIPQLKRTS